MSAVQLFQAGPSNAGFPPLASASVCAASLVSLEARCLQNSQVVTPLATQQHPLMFSHTQFYKLDMQCLAQKVIALMTERLT